MKYFVFLRYLLRFLIHKSHFSCTCKAILLTETMDANLAAAVDRMSIIEKQIAALEADTTLPASAGQNDLQIAEAAVHAYQAQLLPRLKEIRAALGQEGGDIVSVKRERDVAIEENKKLKKEMERMEYRIKHLVKSLNEEEAKNSR